MSAKLQTVGQSMPPIYGVEKATGALRFPADISLPNMLWMKILRSPHAHAKIIDIDVSAAEKMPGVAARGISAWPPAGRLDAERSSIFLAGPEATISSSIDLVGVIFALPLQ